ncbi:MAG TPA: NUDIX domain-containing protein [Candidatus Paceibacterota bacterium]|nr:NUDIX domain-containing protein [Candidatus Paceibacterota bacterium]
MKAETIATLVLVFNPQGRVLLGRKKNGEIGVGLLNAPGGKWDRKETILECAARELQEEAGIIVTTGNLRHLGSVKCCVGNKLIQLVHVYATTEYSGSPRETDSMKDFDWYSPAKLPLDRMHEGDRFWFPKAARRQKFRMQIWYERPGAGYIKHVEGDYNS